MQPDTQPKGGTLRRPSSALSGEPTLAPGRQAVTDPANRTARKPAEDRGRPSKRPLPPALKARQRKGLASPNRGKTFPIEVLSGTEVRALIDSAPANTPAGVRNRAMIAVLYRGGLRCAECLDLYEKDLDLDRGAVSVLRGKGGKRRTVGIGPETVILLERWIALRRELSLGPATPLFCCVRGAQRGRRLYSSAVRSLLPQLAAEAGISKRVHPHALRHTMAYELHNEGVPLALIRAQLGHSRLATTERYLDHFAPAHVIRAMGQRESWLEDANDTSRLARGNE